MYAKDLFLTERFIDRLAALQRWKTDPDIYVSFTALPKIGINPRSPWDTPIGVYCYPLREMYRNIELNQIPYAGEAPYIQVLKSNKATELSQYNDADLARDIGKLRDRYLESLCDGCLWDTRYPRNPDFADIRRAVDGVFDDKSDVEDAYERTFNIAMQTWSEEATHQNYPASKLWNITRWMANMLVDRKKKRINSHMAPAKYSSVMWNALLRGLGYAGFSDKSGIGIIHQNEPISAVFLTGIAFTHVETIRNITKPDRLTSGTLS